MHAEYAHEFSAGLSTQRDPASAGLLAGLKWLSEPKDAPHPVLYQVHIVAGLGQQGRRRLVLPPPVATDKGVGKVVVPYWLVPSNAKHGTRTAARPPLRRHLQ